MSPRFSIAHYHVTAKLGEGGMGAVYRATDTKLHREVAIKVLPDSFAADPDRLLRFTREAQVLASLNHPNIAQIYGVEDRALVMELVPGETLRGPLPPDQALRYALQIAAALAAAHEKGIVHRDLKPANIIATADGTVKVLDFGLAKAADETAIPPASAASPTVTMSPTMAGVILGTAAYMSPEQARGKPVDRRADIWAFGVVFYEMLTGVAPFGGETVTDILAAVITREPDWSAIPERFRPLLRRCLEKDPARRLRDIGDLDLLLTPPPPAPPRRRLAPAIAAGAIASLAIGALGMFLWTHAATPPTAAVTRFTIPLEANEEPSDSPAISPDGRLIAYVSQKGGGEWRLYLRDLAAFQPREVAGSAGAVQPFFSSDGNWLGFFAQGELQKVAVSGGAPIKIAAAPFPFGGAFLDDGSIVYAPNEGSGLLRIAPGAAKPEALTVADGAENGYAHTWPQPLPGGDRVLFSVRGRQTGIAVLSLKTRRWSFVLPKAAGAIVGAAAGRFVHLFVSDESAGIKTGLLDSARPSTVTADTAVLDDVDYQAIGTWVRLGLAVSRSGAAVYIPGNPEKRSLAWVGRDGHVETAISNPAAYVESALSPDGRRVAVMIGSDLWVYDLSNGARHRLTAYGNSGSNASSPVWTRDSARVIFAVNEGADYDLYSQPADASRPPELLLKRPFGQFPTSMSPDGTLLFGESYPDRGEAIFALSPGGQVAAVRVSPASNEINPEFSPDGRRFAYDSDESGRHEIYVEDYPGGGRRVVVSAQGGSNPVWSRDGKELFYVTGDAVMTAQARPDGTFAPAHKLFERSPYYFSWHSYDVAPDGKRLLMIHRDAGSVPRQLNVILNWNEELRQRLPLGAR
jgi:Tol biopolymer transport system component